MITSSYCTMMYDTLVVAESSKNKGTWEDLRGAKEVWHPPKCHFAPGGSLSYWYSFVKLLMKFLAVIK